MPLNVAVSVTGERVTEETIREAFLPLELGDIKIEVSDFVDV